MYIYNTYVYWNVYYLSYYKLSVTGRRSVPLSYQVDDEKRQDRRKSPMAPGLWVSLSIVCKFLERFTQPLLVSFSRGYCWQSPVQSASLSPGNFRYWYKNGCLFPDMLTVFISIDKCNKANGCLQVTFNKQLTPFDLFLLSIFVTKDRPIFNSFYTEGNKCQQC